MISLILTLAVVGFVVWIILQIPMPALVRNIILGIVCFALIIYVLQAFGLGEGLPRLRMK